MRSSFGVSAATRIGLLEMYAREIRSCPTLFLAASLLAMYTKHWMDMHVNIIMYHQALDMHVNIIVHTMYHSACQYKLQRTLQGGLISEYTSKMFVKWQIKPWGQLRLFGLWQKKL